MHICCAQAAAHWASSTMANIPATIGFYPSESILFIGWYVDTSAPTAEILKIDLYDSPAKDKAKCLPPSILLNSGPIVRIDYGDSAALAEVLDFLEEIDEVVYSVIMVSKQDNAAAVLDEIEAEFQNRELNMIAAWQVPEIISDAPITMHRVEPDYIAEFFDHEHDHFCDDAQPHVVGTIFDIAKSKSMRRLSQCGTLPALTRQEATAFVDELPEVASRPSTDIVYFASALVPYLRSNPQALQNFIDQLDQLLALDPAKQLPQIPVPKVKGVIKRFANEKSIGAKEWMALWFTNAFLRDVALAHIAQANDCGKQWCLFIAREFGQVIRANALSVYALLVLDTPLMFQCRPAIAAAQKALPGHSLSKLIAYGYDYGQGLVMRRGALEGSKEAEALALEGGLGDAGIML